MESELLKKEDEFYKENEKLEERTKELMKKVNDVMKIQDNLIKESIKMKSDINFAKNNFGDNKNDDAHHSDVNKTGHQITSQDGVEQIGTNGTIQYYKAKLKFLQVEVVKLQTELKNKHFIQDYNKLTKQQKNSISNNTTIEDADEICQRFSSNEENKKLQIANQSFQEEKEKWFSSYNSSKTRIGKLENQLTCLNTRFQEKSTELTLVKKELENTKKDLKNSTLNANSLEIRLTRAQEENDKLKNALKITKNEEKEIKETFKKQINDLTAIVKLMEKHKIELLNGFKKQLQLIDNLKKQKCQLDKTKTTRNKMSTQPIITTIKFYLQLCYFPSFKSGDSSQSPCNTLINISVKSTSSIIHIPSDSCCCGITSYLGYTNIFCALFLLPTLHCERPKTFIQR